MEWLDTVTEFCRTYHVVAIGAAGLLLAGALSAVFYRPWGDFIVRRRAPKLDLRGKRINSTKEGVCRACLKVWPVDKMCAEKDGRYICGVCREAEHVAVEELRRREAETPVTCRGCKQTYRRGEVYTLKDGTYLCVPCYERIMAKRKQEAK